MKAINPYLNFGGNAEKAFNFYKSVLGGDFNVLQRFGEIPDIAENATEEERNKIMHISLPIGRKNFLMATDAMESMGHSIIVGSNFHISLEAESQGEADRIFAGLSTGAKSTQPMKKEMWGAYFGMLTDQFGIQWMISYNSDNQ